MADTPKDKTKKVGSSWEKLTGTGAYYDPSSVRSRFFKGEANILGERAKPSQSKPAAASSTPVAPREQIGPVVSTAKKKVAVQADTSDITARTPVAKPKKDSPKQGKSRTTKQAAKPKKTAVPKSSPYQDFLSSLSPGNRVGNKLKGITATKASKRTQKTR